MKKKRLIIFGDGNSFITKILYVKLQQEIVNSDFEIIAVVNTMPFVSTSKIKNIFSFIIKKAFNPFDDKIIFSQYGTFLTDIKASLLLEAPNINDINFILKIRQLNPDFALLIGCPQIFKSEIIGCFNRVINYHNSLLPKYRGLEATSWSMQYNEKYTGFTYHYVDNRIDTGNIIIQDKITIDYAKSSFELEIEKTKLASTKFSELLSLISKGYEGIKQNGESSYYGKKEKEKLLMLENLEDIQKSKIKPYIWGGYFYSKITRPSLLQG